MKPEAETYMSHAIRLAMHALHHGGGPFGAVVVRQGELVGQGHNQVVSSADPTAHAEVMAIRDACRRLGTHVLDDCTLYTSCEPCPMCLAAVYWARIPEVVFGADRHAAAAADFADSLIYDELAMPLAVRKVRMQQCLGDVAGEVFTAWRAKTDRVPY